MLWDSYRDARISRRKASIALKKNRPAYRGLQGSMKAVVKHPSVPSFTWDDHLHLFWFIQFSAATLLLGLVALHFCQFSLAISPPTTSLALPSAGEVGNFNVTVSYSPPDGKSIVTPSPSAAFPPDALPLTSVPSDHLLHPPVTSLDSAHSVPVCNLTANSSNRTVAVADSSSSSTNSSISTGLYTKLQLPANTSTSDYALMPYAFSAFKANSSLEELLCISGSSLPHLLDQVLHPERLMCSHIQSANATVLSAASSAIFTDANTNAAPKNAFRSSLLHLQPIHVAESRQSLMSAAADSTSDFSMLGFGIRGSLPQTRRNVTATAANSSFDLSLWDFASPAHYVQRCWSEVPWTPLLLDIRTVTATSDYTAEHVTYIIVTPVSDAGKG